MRVGPWTQSLKWSFFLLQVFGIYLAAGVLVILALGAFFILSLASIILRQPQPTYEDAAGYLVNLLVGQPLVIVGIVAVVVTAICITVGASRQRAWAHWAAMVLIALSMVPAILMIAGFRDWIWWLIGLPYCAGCMGFLTAMTLAFKRYGAWRVPRPDAGVGA